MYSNLRGNGTFLWLLLRYMWLFKGMCEWGENKCDAHCLLSSSDPGPCKTHTHWYLSVHLGIQVVEKTLT